MNETIAMPENIKQAYTKYNSYDLNCWTQACFDYNSGGFNVYHKDHQFSKIGGGGDAERIVGRMLAECNGKQVEFLPEGGRKSPDFRFDGQTWDVKFINNANENTIRLYIKDARKAKNALFYFTNDKYEELISAVNREAGYLNKLNRLAKMPHIYYLNEQGILTLILQT